MILHYRPIKVRPEEWATTVPKHSPFSASWGMTLDLLEREVYALRGTEPTLQVDAEASALRMDGGLRADARLNDCGVILSFDTAKFGTLTYPCRAFLRWQDNVRAIALGLEALRKVERYGIADRGQQYAGFAELPSGIAAGARMSVDQAWRLLCEAADLPLSMPMLGDNIALVWKLAAQKTHPDVGGDEERFKELAEAKELVEAHTTH